MRSKISILLLSVITPFFVLAQNSTLLWKIEGNGLQQASYLFATVHVQDKKAFNFNDSVLPALDLCEAFAMEVILENIPQDVILSSMTYGENKTLKDEISKKTYKRTQRIFKDELELDLAAYEHFRPFGIASLLSQKQTQTADLAPYIVDDFLYQKAKSSAKQLFSIEEIKTQLQLFQSFGEKELLASFDDFENDPLINNKLMTQLVDAYAQEDLEKLSLLVHDNKNEATEDFYRRMFEDRNIDMAESIENIISKQSTFVAIGAGHFLGKEGVIELLKQKGFSIRPIVAPRSGNVSLDLNNTKTEEDSTITDNFEINFPSEPKKTTQSLDTQVGKMNIVSYMLEVENNDSIQNSLYGLGHVLYPDEVIENISSEEILNFTYDAAVSQSAASVGGEIIQQENIEIEGYTARKALLSMNDLIENGELEIIYILAGKHMYFLQVGYDPTSKNAVQKEAFYSSFRLHESTTNKTLNNIPLQETAFIEKESSLSKTEEIVNNTILKPDSNYYLQAGYFSSSSNAETRISDLQKLGINANSKKFMNGYRVIIKHAETKEALSNYLKEMEENDTSWPDGDRPVIKQISK